MITSTSNQHVRLLRELLGKRKAREEAGLFVLEGLRMAREIPRDYIQDLYVSESFSRRDDQMAEFAHLSPQVLSDRVFTSLSDTRSPQGILAAARMPVCDRNQLYAGRAPLLLFLENIQDPGNLGTIIRTALGAGADGLVMSRDTVDIFSPKVVRASMGSLFRLPFIYTSDLTAELEEAAARGVAVYAAALGAEQIYTAPDYRSPCGFIIGNEGNGLTPQAIRAAASSVEIPLGGRLESLNASVAAAVLLFEAARQRMIS